MTIHLFANGHSEVSSTGMLEPEVTRFGEEGEAGE